MAAKIRRSIAVTDGISCSTTESSRSIRATPVRTRHPTTRSRTKDATSTSRFRTISVAGQSSVRLFRITSRDCGVKVRSYLGIPQGNAVRIGGEFLMYLSEGCNGTLQIGRSGDLIHWTFEECAYLDVSPLEGALHEVACATTAFGEHGHLVIDLFYSDEGGTFRSAQALYHQDEPFTQIALKKGGTLSWGGLLKHQGTWLFAQGWDAPEGTRELYVYRSHQPV